MKELQCGIIGPGNHAQENLLPALNNVEGMKLYAVQSRNKDRADAIAARYHIPRTVVSDNVTALLDNDKCDAVVASATPEVHQRLLQYAIEHKKNIFVEKPPTSDLSSLKAVKEALASMPEPPAVQFGFNFKHSDFYRQLEDVTKATGPIRYMKIKSYAAKPDMPMWHYEDVLTSSLYAIHIHAIEMLCYTLGSLADVTHRLLWIDNSKYVLTITARFEDNRLGVLELSNMSNRFEFSVECIDASKNVLRCSDFNHMTAFGPSFDASAMLTTKSFITYNIPFLRGGFDRTGYSRQFEHFRDLINNGQQDLKSLDSCIDAYKIIEGVTDGT